MIRESVKNASIKKLFNQIPPAMLAVFVCAFVFLCGCGNVAKNIKGTDNTAVSGDGVSLNETAEVSKVISEKKGVINVAGNIPEIPGFDAATEAFNECYPNVEIKYEDILTEIYNEKKESGEEDRALDKLSFSERDALYRLALERSFENGETDIFISDKILLDRSEITLSNTAALDEEGECLAIPLYVNVSGLLVNETALTEYDLDIPTEYVEFVSDCFALKDEGVRALAGDEDIYLNLLAGLCVSDLTENSEPEDSVSALNNADEDAGDYLAQSFEVLKFLYKNRFFDTGLMAELEDRERAVDSFESGDIVFMPTDAMTAASVSTNSIKYSFVPMPMGSDGAITCIQNGTMLSLAQNGENHEIAETFMTFLRQSDVLDMVAEKAGAVSAAADFSKECFDSVPENVEIYTDSGISASVLDIYNYVLNEVADGHLTVKSAVKKFDELNARSQKEYKRTVKGKKTSKGRKQKNTEEPEKYESSNDLYESANDIYESANDL